MSWDAIEQASFGGEEALVFFHGVWRVTDQMKACNLKGKDDYFHKITWINAPAGKKGGKPTNLSHPIAYAVSAKSKNKELAAYIVALASQPIPNMRHAVTTNHTPINYGEQSMPEVVDKGWALVAATPMLKYASFMPNHPKIGQYNAIIFKGIQGVETGRLTRAGGDRFRRRRAAERARQGRGDHATERRSRADRASARQLSLSAPATSPPCPTSRAPSSAASAPTSPCSSGRRWCCSPCFFVAPVDRRRGARVHRHGPHAGGHQVHAREFRADGHARHAAARRRSASPPIFVLGDARHLQRHLRAAAGAGHDRRAAAASARSSAPCGCCRG